MERSRRIAADMLDVDNKRDSVKTNMRIRLRADEDYIINVGKDVYGILNNQHITFGYDDERVTNRYDILYADNKQKVTTGTYDIECDTFNMNTAEYILNGRVLNDDVMMGAEFVQLSSNVIEALKRLHNIDTAMPVITDEDIKRVPIFQVDTDSKTRRARYLSSFDLPELKLNKRDDLL